MNSDGTNQINLSNSSNTCDVSPSWSPDGMKIVYASGSSTLTQIWVMDYPSGSNKKRITDNQYSNGSPGWSR